MYATKWQFCIFLIIIVIVLCSTIMLVKEIQDGYVIAFLLVLCKVFGQFGYFKQFMGNTRRCEINKNK